MKRALKTLVARVVQKGLPDSVLQALAPVVSKGPVPWDEAAVQLDYLRAHVIRVGYPQYLYGLLCAARTARAVGLREFSAIEFGVAGGNGLVALEEHAAAIEQQTNMSIRIFGFDSGAGLPPRTDPRDCPFAFRGGEYKMNEPELRARLKRAELRLGDVAQTVPTFTSENFPPLGFISNDLDYYTSTRDSFALLKLPSSQLLPRVVMYFDDLLGYPYTTITGEWAAINEFNSAEKHRRLGSIFGLKYTLGPHYRFTNWSESFFLLHVFDHPNYNFPESVPSSAATELHR